MLLSNPFYNAFPGKCKWLKFCLCLITTAPCHLILCKLNCLTWRMSTSNNWYSELIAIIGKLCRQSDYVNELCHKVIEDHFHWNKHWEFHNETSIYARVSFSVSHGITNVWYPTALVTLYNSQTIWSIWLRLPLMSKISMTCKCRNVFFNLIIRFATFTWALSLTVHAIFHVLFCQTITE